ncbi:MAG: FkbM family methyltransferase [Patescibacteria group bacterium]|jgi:FkbM family methyltransferase
MDKKDFYKEDFSLSEKIFWRLKKISALFGRIDFDVLLFSLQSAKRRGGWPLMKFLRRKKITNIDGGENILNYGAYKFKVPADSLIVADLVAIFSYRDKYFKKNFLPSCSFDGPYEMNGFEMKKGDFVIDAGANVGIFSLLAGDIVGSSGLVFAFEPVPLAADFLEKNILLNKRKNIKVLKFGLGSKAGKADFNLFSSLEESLVFFTGGREKIELDIISLDDFVKNNKIEKIDFIKADIEGMERDLLLGAKEVIKKFNPKLSICTYHRPDDPEVLSAIIKEFCSDYEIIFSEKKLFAQVQFKNNR